MITTFKVRLYPNNRQVKELKKIANGVDEIWNYINNLQSYRMINYAEVGAKVVEKKDKKGKTYTKEFIEIKNKKAKAPLTIPYSGGIEKQTEQGLLLRWEVLSHFTAQYTEFGRRVGETFNLPSATAAKVCEQYNTNYKLYFSKKIKNLIDHKFKLKPRQGADWIPFRDGQVKVLSKNKIKFNGIELTISEDKNSIYDIVTQKNNKYFGDEKSIRSGVISVDAFGKWWVSVALNVSYIEQKEDLGVPVGIDPGFNTCITTSSGDKFERPIKELSAMQKRVDDLKRKAMKSKGGKVRVLTEEVRVGKRKVQKNIFYKPSYFVLKKAGKLQNKINLKKREWEKQVAKEVVAGASEVYIGQLNLRALSRVYGKSVHREAIHTLIKAIENRGAKFGVEVHSINESFTTVTCSSCGEKTGPSGQAQLSIREWVCSSCGEVHDRDTNAAKNILKLGLEQKENKSDKKAS